MPTRSINGWTRRQALWLIAGAVGGLTLHGCGQSGTGQSSSGDSTGSMAASIATTLWIGNTPLYIALEKGFFRDLGLELDVKTFGTVAEGFPALTAGQLDGAAPVTAEAVSLSARGVDYRAVLVMDTSKGADGILARNSVANVADFKGKSIALQEGGVGHFFVLQVLAEAGLRGDDITIINTTPDAAAAAYEAGNVEIAYSYSPFMEKANEAQPDGRIIYDSSKMPAAIADLFIFRTDFIEQNPEAVQAFVQGVLQGLDFLISNPDEALPLAAKRLELTPEDLAMQLEGIGLPDLATNLSMLGDPSSDVYMLEPMQALAEFLHSQGQIESVPDLSQVLDPQFL